MAAHEHVSMKTGLSGNTAEPSTTGRCARRQTDWQCAVARFELGVPWPRHPGRTATAGAGEALARVQVTTARGSTWAASAGHCVRNRPQGC